MRSKSVIELAREEIFQEGREEAIEEIKELVRKQEEALAIADDLDKEIKKLAERYEIK